MISIGDSLIAYLLADSTITALVGQRVYPVRFPEKAPMPAVVVTRISGARIGNLRTPASLARPRFQVDAWATSLAGATALGRRCRLRLEGFSGAWADGESPETSVGVAVQFEDEREFFEEDILGGLCRHSADYFVWHQTAAGAV